MACLAVQQYFTETRIYGNIGQKMLPYNIFCIILYEETKIILHRAEEIFPSLKESQRFPYLPKLGQGYCSENFVTHSHHAYEAVITNDMEMTDIEEKNVTKAK